jgi:hypothetical protein
MTMTTAMTAQEAALRLAFLLKTYDKNCLIMDLVTYKMVVGDNITPEYFHSYKHFSKVVKCAYDYDMSLQIQKDIEDTVSFFLVKLPTDGFRVSAEVAKRVLEGATRETIWNDFAESKPIIENESTKKL